MSEMSLVTEVAEKLRRKVVEALIEVCSDVDYCCLSEEPGTMQWDECVEFAQAVVEEAGFKDAWPEI